MTSVRLAGRFSCACSSSDKLVRAHKIPAPSKTFLVAVSVKHKSTMDPVCYAHELFLWTVEGQGFCWFLIDMHVKLLLFNVLFANVNINWLKAFQKVKIATNITVASNRLFLFCSGCVGFPSQIVLRVYY